MPTFTGLVRRRQTSRLVAFADRAARATITFGGIATIVAVAVVCLFLLWVALPLLGSGHTSDRGTVAVPAGGSLLHIAEDPYRHLAWRLQRDGQVVAFATADGRELARESLFDPASVTSVAPRGTRVLLGRGDGSLVLCTVEFTSDVMDEPGSAVAAALPIGGVAVDGALLFERTPEDQFRVQRLKIHREEPLPIAAAAVLHADVSELGSGLLLAAVTADGGLHFKRRSVRYDFGEDREIAELSGVSVALRDVAPGLGGAQPDHVLLTGAGDSLLLVWNDGRLLRLDVRDRDVIRQAEELDLLPDDRRIACLHFMIGKTTLLVGDDRGEITSWFCTKPRDAGTVDGAVLQRAFTLAPAAPSPVVSLHASQRSRLFVAGHADGVVRVCHGTSHRLVAHVQAPDRILHVALSPKEDGLLAAAADRLYRWDLDAAHPEVTPRTAFLPVWYEGAARPEHVWQSTAGTDDFEPKFGLWPLIYGTLKATLYCLLFGVPIALFAAIYTSEFLHRRWRSRIKPVIELMASLPSVVLGFLAGIVFAPFVSEHLMTVLLSILAVPVVFLAGAQAWQQAPAWLRPTTERLRVPAALLAVPTGLWLASTIAPGAESVLFGGDLKDWLAQSALPPGDPGRESAFGGWLLLAVPIAAALAAFLIGRLGVGVRRANTAFGRFGVGAVLAAALAVGLALLLTRLGLDLRGSLFGTFDPRNSLVVGIAMGFAVVPIIYTIAEDALSAVPEHLRAASLGAGATPWQTATRVILPTAMSGVFSAVMIGLGRAVGETMIIVMAVGGTPIMELNVFNGFRTLSANIATELPEAVRDSSHYRMLYLAALCLFVMTFVLNTLAEVVRQRFRRRAFQL